MTTLKDALSGYKAIYRVAGGVVVGHYDLRSVEDGASTSLLSDALPPAAMPTVSLLDGPTVTIPPGAVAGTAIATVVAVGNPAPVVTVTGQTALRVIGTDLVLTRAMPTGNYSFALSAKNRVGTTTAPATLVVQAAAAVAVPTLRATGPGTVDPATPAAGDTITYTGVPVTSGTAPYSRVIVVTVNGTARPAVTTETATIELPAGVAATVVIADTVTDSTVPAQTVTVYSTVSASIGGGTSDPLTMDSPATITPASPQPGQSVTYTGFTPAGGTAPYSRVIAATINGTAQADVTGASATYLLPSVAGVSVQIVDTVADADGQALSITTSFSATLGGGVPITISAPATITPLSAGAPLTYTGAAATGGTGAVSSTIRLLVDGVPVATSTTGALTYAVPGVGLTGVIEETFSDEAFPPATARTLTVISVAGGPANDFAAMPAYLDVGTTIPTTFGRAGAYAANGDLLKGADHYLAENAGKSQNIALTVDPATLAVGADWSGIASLDAQISASGGAMRNDLHGTVMWHQQQAPSLRQAIRDNLANPDPKTIIGNLVDLVQGSPVQPEWLDINETLSTLNTRDPYYDFRRGPVLSLERSATTGFATTMASTEMTLTNRPGRSARLVGGTYTEVTAAEYLDPTDSQGSFWYDAFGRAIAASPSYFAHGVAMFPLWAVRSAQDGGYLASIQDFNLEAGRAWGTNAETDPAGYENGVGPNPIPTRRGDEQIRRTVYLDMLNYAAVHAGADIGIPDAMAMQFHISPARMVDEKSLALMLISTTALNIPTALTEIDVELDARPAGGARVMQGNAKTVETETYAGHYLRRLTHIVAKYSRLTRVRGWSGWTPTGTTQRLGLIDMTGKTRMWNAVADAHNSAIMGTALLAPEKRVVGAAAADERSVGPVLRYYDLTGGVTMDVWRSTTDSAARAFDVLGGANGTPLLAGVNGARLRLTNTGVVPGGPVAARFWHGAGYADINPASFGLLFQLTDNANSGVWLRLMGAAGEIFRVRRNTGSVEYSTNGGASYTVMGAVSSSGQRTIMFRLHDGAVTLRVAIGASTIYSATIPTTDSAAYLDVLGDGTAAAAAARGVMAIVFRDPPDDGSLARWVVPHGAHTLSAAQIIGNTNPWQAPEYVPLATSIPVPTAPTISVTPTAVTIPADAEPGHVVASITVTGYPAPSVSISVAWLERVGNQIRLVSLPAAGAYDDIQISAENSAGDDIALLDATVEAAQANRPPVGGGVVITDATVGETATVDVSAYFSDPDGDDLTFTQQGAWPAGASLTGATLSFQPGEGGTFNIQVRATDTGGLFANRTFRFPATAASGGTVPQAITQGAETVTVSAVIGTASGADGVTYVCIPAGGASVTRDTSITLRAGAAGSSGAMLNPRRGQSQGFDAGVMSFSAGANAAFPLAVVPGDTLVLTQSRTDYHATALGNLADQRTGAFTGIEVIEFVADLPATPGQQIAPPALRNPDGSRAPGWTLDLDALVASLPSYSTAGLPILSGASVAVPVLSQILDRIGRRNPLVRMNDAAAGTSGGYEVASVHRFGALTDTNYGRYPHSLISAASMMLISDAIDATQKKTLLVWMIRHGLDWGEPRAADSNKFPKALSGGADGAHWQFELLPEIWAWWATGRAGQLATFPTILPNNQFAQTFRLTASDVTAITTPHDDVSLPHPSRRRTVRAVGSFAVTGTGAGTIDRGIAFSYNGTADNPWVNATDLELVRESDGYVYAMPDALASGQAGQNVGGQGAWVHPIAAGAPLPTLTVGDVIYFRPKRAVTVGMAEWRLDAELKMWNTSRATDYRELNHNGADVLLVAALGIAPDQADWNEMRDYAIRAATPDAWDLPLPFDVAILPNRSRFVQTFWERHAEDILGISAPPLAGHHLVIAEQSITAWNLNEGSFYDPASLGVGYPLLANGGTVTVTYSPKDLSANDASVLRTVKVDGEGAQLRDQGTAGVRAMIESLNFYSPAGTDWNIGFIAKGGSSFTQPALGLTTPGDQDMTALEWQRMGQHMRDEGINPTEAPLWWYGSPLSPTTNHNSPHGRSDYAAFFLTMMTGRNAVTGTVLSMPSVVNFYGTNKNYAFVNTYEDMFPDLERVIVYEAPYFDGVNSDRRAMVNGAQTIRPAGWTGAQLFSATGPSYRPHVSDGHPLAVADGRLRYMDQVAQSLAWDKGYLQSRVPGGQLPVFDVCEATETQMEIGWSLAPLNTVYGLRSIQHEGAIQASGWALSMDGTWEPNNSDSVVGLVRPATAVLNPTTGRVILTPPAGQQFTSASRAWFLGSRFATEIAAIASTDKALAVAGFHLVGAPRQQFIYPRPGTPIASTWTSGGVPADTAPTITVTPATITIPASATAGDVVGNVSVTGNPAPTITVSVPWLSVEADGDIVLVTPQAVGTYSGITFTAANGVSPNATASRSVVVSNADPSFMTTGTGPYFVAAATTPNTKIIEFELDYEEPQAGMVTSRLMARASTGCDLLMFGSGYQIIAEDATGAKMLNSVSISAPRVKDTRHLLRMVVDMEAGTATLSQNGTQVWNQSFTPTAGSERFEGGRLISVLGSADGNSLVAAGVRVYRAEVFTTNTDNVRTSNLLVQGNAATVNALATKRGTDAAPSPDDDADDPDPALPSVAPNHLVIEKSVWQTVTHDMSADFSAGTPAWPGGSPQGAIPPAGVIIDGNSLVIGESAESGIFQVVSGGETFSYDLRVSGDPVSDSYDQTVDTLAALTAALDQTIATGIGRTILLAAGYYGDLTLTGKAYPVGTRVIFAAEDSANITAHVGLVNLTGTSNLTLSRLSCRGLGAVGLVNLTNATGITIEGGHIRGQRHDPMLPLAGVYVNPEYAVFGTGVSGLTIRNNLIEHVSRGFGFSGLLGPITIEGNEIRFFHQAGGLVKPSAHAQTLRFNYIHSPMPNAGSDPAAINLQLNGETAQITGLEIIGLVARVTDFSHGQVLHGIVRTGAGATDSGVDGAVIAGNILTGNAVNGILIDRGAGNTVAHNTVAATATGGSVINAIQIGTHSGSQANPQDVRSNIADGTAGGSGATMTGNVAAGAGGATISYTALYPGWSATVERLGFSDFVAAYAPAPAYAAAGAHAVTTFGQPRAAAGWSVDMGGV